MPSEGYKNRRDRRTEKNENPRKILLAKKEEEPQPKLQLLQPKRETPKVDKPEAPSKPKEALPQEDLMTKPLALLTSELVLSPETFSAYVQEASLGFKVVGFVGCQNSGKSTLANVLLNSECSMDDILLKQTEVFPTRGRKHTLQINPVTEGIDMFISRDRLIVLDCGPFLTNFLHKEHILQELDDLKTIIFLLNVCHQLVVVENSYVNPSLMRLLVCADMMRTHLKEFEGSEHGANVMFIHNKARPEDLTSSERRQRTYHKVFRQSSFDICSQKAGAAEDVNFLTFPDLQDLDPHRISDLDKVRLHISQFRRRVLMQNNLSFVSLNEKLWLQMAAKAWEMNSSNYFLKKYATLKEKFNLLNHVSINENSKERNIYFADE